MVLVFFQSVRHFLLFFSWKDTEEDGKAGLQSRFQIHSTLKKGYKYTVIYEIIVIGSLNGKYQWTFYPFILLETRFNTKI